MAEQVANFPGPSTLQSVEVGRSQGCATNCAEFRAVMWSDGRASLIVESGAMYMQLQASYEELHALREMLADVLADMPATEAV